MSTTTRAPRILYFAVRYDFYPRNRRVRQYLEERYDADIVIVPALIRGNVVLRYLKQLRLAWRAGRDYDLVVLAEFNLHYFPFSWLAAKRSRSPHLVDFFVGKYESAVLDRRTYKADSLKARALKLVDRGAILSSTSCVTDTGVRAREFSAIANDAREFRVLPVGAPAWAYPRPVEKREGGPTRLLYYGNYIPLHGLDALVAALPHLTEDVTITMIGNGSRRQGVEDAIAAAGFSDRVVFRDHVDEKDLAGIIAEHDVVLGIFGASSKAAGVIANKVWQGLYMGKVVVTRSSEALDEISDICGPHLAQVADTAPEPFAAALDAAIRSSRSVDLESSTIATDLEASVRARFDAVFDAVLGAPRA